MRPFLNDIGCRLACLKRRYEIEREWLPLLQMSRGHVEADQRHRLQRLLIYSALHVPYYRDLHIDLQNDWPNVPVLSKDVIRAESGRMLSDTFSREALIEKSTGGSTGEPLVFYRHREYLHASQMGTFRNLSLCGWLPGDPVANFWGVNDPRHFRKRALKERFGMGFYTFNAFDAGPQVFGEWLSRLEGIRPVTFYGYASTIWLFCKWMKDIQPRKARKTRKGWDHRLKGVFLTAERLHGFQRELIEEVLGVPVFSLYGSTEIQNIAFECTHGNMHVATDFVVAEVDAPQGEMGDFLLTSLHNYAMPFIRYRNGDRGRLLGYVCDCGIKMPCISLDISRTCDNFRTRSGRVIHGEFFTHVMEGIQGVAKFQFRQTSLERVELRVVRAKGGELRAESLGQRAESGEERVGAIPGIVREKTDGELQVEVMWVNEIPPTNRGKHLFTISEIEA